MDSAPHDDPSAFATVRRARLLLTRFTERAGPDSTSRAPWLELSASLTTLEQAANAARATSADWLAKAALARAEHRSDLAETADRRAALAEQEFAAYLSEIAGIWDFLENGAQEPLAAPAAADG
jgi:hypothetical protein